MQETCNLKFAHQRYKTLWSYHCYIHSYMLMELTALAKDNMSSSLLQLNPLINVSHIRFLGRDPGQSLVRSQSQSIYTG